MVQKAQFGYCRLGTPLNHLYCDYYRRLMACISLSIYFTGLYLTDVYSWACILEMCLTCTYLISVYLIGHAPYGRVCHVCVS
jgi:hypothetical protein